jgi:hypothetical protein
VGLERGPLSLESTTEDLLGRSSSGSGLEIRGYGRRDPSRLLRDTLFPQNLALSSPTSRGRSVGIVRLRTQAKELLLLLTEFTELNYRQRESSFFFAVSSLGETKWGGGEPWTLSRSFQTWIVLYRSFVNAKWR